MIRPWYSARAPISWTMYASSPVSRLATSRTAKLFGSYAFTEGWAHYTEEMMVEAGFGEGDLRVRLGQLSNALLRNCRFLAAIGLHTRGMTVDEAERLFRDRC
jgi:uncharacterized protein (DUF885 family)